MTLLPGGQYLVASASVDGLKGFLLCIFAMDTNPPRLLATDPLTSKVYDIQAKYMTIHNRPSIAIAYLRRFYHHKHDRKKEYAHVSIIRLIG